MEHGVSFPKTQCNGYEDTIRTCMDSEVEDNRYLFDDEDVGQPEESAAAAAVNLDR
jgi:hypothetical protein